MKNAVKEMYEQIKMPEACVQRTREAMMQMKESKFEKRFVFRPAVALAALLIVGLGMDTRVQAAVNDLVVKYFFPDSGITIYEEKDEDGDVIRTLALDTEASTFAHVEGGRLYFTGNGENIDITEKTAEDAPYYYTYVDEYGLTHYMVVGYAGSIENFGVYEFMREEQEGQKDWEGWSNGHGRNFQDPETDAAYPWVVLVWEELNVPWPMPGT